VLIWIIEYRMWIVCIDGLCIIHYHYNDLNLFFPFHLAREEISEIYRYIIFNNIFLNFTKSSVLDLFPAMYIPIQKKNEEEAVHISKLTFLFIRKEALNKKEINIILKFLFFCIFHNNIRIGSRACQNWRCVWSEGDSEFIRVISNKVRVVQIQLGWLLL